MKHGTFFISLFFAFLIISSLHAADFSHQLFDSLLRKYVNENGMVNYKGIKAHHELLQSYLDKLKNVDAQNFEKWSRQGKMAFWINAYNAITIEGIVRNYPIPENVQSLKENYPKNSIQQIKDFWNTVFIKVMGKNITLTQIENDYLRKQFKDPRIHAALVCAALGCPKLINRAYTAGKLDQQLDKVMHDFINNPEKVRLDESANKLYISSIFNWYKEDFKASGKFKGKLNNYDEDLRGAVEFVMSYLPQKAKDYILKNQPEIVFLNYDWTLNEQK